MASRDTTLSAIAVLAHAYPNTKLSADAIELWVHMLEDVDDTALLAGVHVLINENTGFAPAVGQVRHAAFDAQLADDERGSAIEAWNGTVHNAWSDEAFEAVGGRYAQARWREQDMPSHRARYIEAYNAAKARDLRVRRLHPKIGGMLQAAQDTAGLLNSGGESDG